MAKLKTKTVVLDVLLWGVPSAGSFIATFWYSHPLLYATSVFFLLLLMRVTYLRLRG